MSKMKLVLVAVLLLATCILSGQGASGELESSADQSSYLLRTSVIGTSGYGQPGASPVYKITGTLGQSNPVGDGTAAGKALYAGFWAAAWAPPAVTIDIAIDCPPDLMIPAYSTVRDIALSGFRITNRSSLDLSVGYSVSTSGSVLNLVDNGNPASISGTTPPLEPGASFSPPDAALVIPEIRHLVIQNVKYRSVPVGSANFEDSCMTTISIEPPVTDYISSFEAQALDQGVELTWVTETDDKIKGFNIYRRDNTVDLLVNADQLILPETCSYFDGDIRPNVTYKYTLSVVREDDTEIRSQMAKVKTKNVRLALRQNYPNPFNPTTTISFTLPERARVNLNIFNVKGELVKTLVDGILDAGLTEIEWDGSNADGNPVSSGLYLYKLKVGAKVLTKKMVLLK